MHSIFITITVTFPESPLGHPGRRARDRLRERRTEGEALGTAA